MRWERIGLGGAEANYDFGFLKAPMLTPSTFLLTFPYTEAIPVVCYGLFNVLQHSIFMVQFYLYSSVELDPKKTDTSEPEPALPPGHPHHKPVNAFVTRSGATASHPLSWLRYDQFLASRSHYLLWILFPIIPLVLARLWPWTIAYTNSIKPIGQIMSHVPQVIECIKLRTTLGISMSSQHLNFLGGAMGLLMCIIIPPIYKTTYLIYFNSVFQAVSIYAIALYYREPLFPSFGKESPALPPL